LASLFDVAGEHQLYLRLRSSKRERGVLVVRWAEEAAEDLATIIDHIDQRNPAAARRLHDDIVITAENLGERPFL
jgi:uncharacterized protein YcaQ